MTLSISLLIASLGAATYCLTSAIGRRSSWQRPAALSAGLAVVLLGLGLLGLGLLAR